jgi:hypothetical protein
MREHAFSPQTAEEYMARNAVRSAAALVALLLPLGAEGQIPAGPDFQVNGFTTDRQNRSSVASDAAGNFVVVWQSRSQDGSDYGIFARRYDASGAPLGGSEFRVNSMTAYAQTGPRVASSAAGQLVVAWDSPDGSANGVFARRFSSAGAPLGLDFPVNGFTTNVQRMPAVASDANGNFVVVWQSLGQDAASSEGVFGRLFDAAGVPRGPEFQVNSFTTGRQARASVAMDATGGFVVVWTSYDQDGSSAGILGQRFDALGARAGAEFQVNSYTPYAQFRPSVASDAAGNFVVTWASYLPANTTGILGQRFNAAGLRQGAEFHVDPGIGYANGYNQVSSDPSGNFVVAWDANPTGLNRDVYARRYDSAGVPEGPEFLVNAYATGYQVAGSVAVDAARFVVTWTDYGRDGYLSGVFAQRLLPDLILKDDFERGDLSAWTGSATDSGDLAVSTAAALNFSTAGLQGVVDDTAALYVQDDRPGDENRYRARFYFDPNGFDPGEAQAHLRTRLFIAFEEAPTRRLAAVVLRRQSGVHAVMLRCRLDDNSQDNSGFFPISDAPHWVEIDWQRATGPDALDGACRLWIDGASVSTRTNLDNSLSGVDFVRMGALSVKTGASGTLYWDDFESRRQGDIGP